MTIHTVSGPAKPLSRRTVLRAGAAAGGGLLLGFYAPFADAAVVNTNGAPPVTGPFAPDAFIRIDRAGKVTLIMPQVEMGQGVYTSISMILAEELDADWSRVKLEHAPPDEKHYANPMLGIQATGNSNSIRAFWKNLRQAGAGARAILVQAAAAQWKVDAASCTANAGVVIHAPTGRKLAYGALADAAAKLPLPQNPPLKDPKNFKLIGRPLKRLDTPDKVNGKALYGIDIPLAGRGLDEDGTRGGAGLTQLRPEGPYGIGIAGRLDSENGIGVQRIARRRRLDRDHLERRIEFFGDDHR